MSKCFQCIKDWYHTRIKWSNVEDAIVILNGTGYCYEHLKKEIGWDKSKRNPQDLRTKEDKR
jgi:hypothetical protein